MKETSLVKPLGHRDPLVTCIQTEFISTLRGNKTKEVRTKKTKIVTRIIYLNRRNLKKK